MLPLSSIKVIELGGLSPVPMCGMILSDYGARVIRIDNIRAPYVDEVLNRGKQSVCLDLKKPQEVSILRRLLQTADVLLDPFRPGVLERMNLSPPDLQRENPRLIVARLSGYGQPRPEDDKKTSRLRSNAGHDINYVAMSGILSMLGPREPEAPQPPVNLLADYAGGGMGAVIGVLLALLSRAASGRGSIVDCSLTHSCAYLCSFLWRSRDRTPFLWPHLGRRASNVLDGGAPFYRCYRTRDGRYMAVGAIEPPFYSRLLRLLAVAEKDAPQADVERWPQIASRFADEFAKRTSEEWVEAVQAQGDCCVTPVLCLDEAASLWLQDFLVDVDGMREPCPQPRLGEEAAKTKVCRPVVGADTEEVLREAGCTEADILTVMTTLKANL